MLVLMPSSLFIIRSPEYCMFHISFRLGVFNRTPPSWIAVLYDMAVSVVSVLICFPQSFMNIAVVICKGPVS